MDPHVLAPGQAPTPFTADEIRDGCPAGRTITLKIFQGEAAFLRINRYVDCDEDGAVIERSRLTLDGSPVGEPESERETWAELQAHASFLADVTTIDDDRIETALGALDCLRYTVRDGDTEQVFWFAKDLPGMPIHFQTKADGEVVSTVSVIEDTALSG